MNTTINTRLAKRVIVVIVLLAAVLVIMSAGQGQLQVSAQGTGPCDIYASGGTPCVAAHSTVRALYGSYNGNLYQVRRASDNATMNIGVLEAGGFANAAAQDSFCAGTSCTITIIYDQSGQGNHLTPSPPGGVCGALDPANATALPLTVGGHDVYGIYITQGVGYRDNTTSGIATGDQPEGMYAVMSGTRYNNGCCFDYGNAETNNLNNGNGHMEAIYFGDCTIWGEGSGSGPWVMADLENGLFAGQTLGTEPNNTSIYYDYVTAIVKGEPNHFAIRAGDAQSGGLTTMYDGARPTISGYNPMHKEGAIILGTGGDNSCSAIGNFYEGAMTSGYPSNSTENAVQANIVAAGYGYSGPTPTPEPPLQDPVHYYTFDGNANDSGSGSSVANGTVTGGTYVSGQIGQAINLSGSNQYVSFPTGFVSGLNDFSIATWVRLDSISDWSRVFDFGSGESVNMFLTPQNGSTGAVRFAITTSGNGNEQQITGSSALPTGAWTHVAVTKSGNTGTLYVNGSVVGTNNSMSLSPSSLGNTSQNWIGRSQYSADPYLDGQVDDFRIYNRALSSSEVSALASGGATPTPTNTPVGPTNTPTNTPTPSQGPMVWYEFNQSSGTTASDSSGNGQNATLVNGPTWVSGIIGNAVNLDGSNDYVSMPSGVVSSLTNFSIATWVRLDSISNWSRVFDFGTGTTVNMFLTPQNGSTGAVRFAITTSGNGSEQQITGSSALPTGTWTHVAVTKSGNTGRLYVNGSQVGSNSSMTLSPSSLGSTNQNWIGRSQYSADPYLDGQVDDFRIYNRALSSSEVNALASGGATPTPTNTPVGPTNTPTATPTATPTGQPGGLIPQNNWTLHYVDSEELSGEDGAATNAFDGNTGTIWHTEWYNSDPPHPHEIQINLGASYDVSGFRYLPRQDGNANGRISQYQFYVSTSPSNWGSAVATGTFANSSSEKEVTFAAKTGQYVRLVALSEVNGNPWTSAAEINVLGTSSGGPTPTPTNTPVPSSTYQAENASLGGGVSVDTNHIGYNGTGFVNFPSSGGYVEYQNVDGGSGGSRTLQFRFALGATSSRTGSLTVNGSSQNITFQPTGAWNSWNTMNVTVNLNSGTNNTIRLQSTGQDLANQDQMTVN
jgi:hypothetical protein